MTFFEITAAAAALLAAGAAAGRWLFPKRQEWKTVEVPKLYPMGADTFAYACALCKHHGKDETRCANCLSEVESGFEYDGCTLSRADKLEIEVCILRDKCKRLSGELNAQKWTSVLVGDPMPNEVVWTIRKLDGIEISVNKECIDEDGHWTLGEENPVLAWHPLPPLPDRL